MIGARQQTSDDLRFESSDGKTVLIFSRDKERNSLQVEINGEWLWLSPFEAERLTLWLDKTRATVRVGV